MTTTTTTTAPVTIPVRIRMRDIDAEGEPRVSQLIVTGWPVASGLAVHVTVDDGGHRLDGRYSLVHLASGLTITQRLCARHVDQAAAAAIATGIDWTEDSPQVLADPRVNALRPGSVAWDWCGYDDFCRPQTYPRPESPTYDPTRR